MLSLIAACGGGSAKPTPTTPIADPIPMAETPAEPTPAVDPVAPTGPAVPAVPDP
ncbi:MAG: ABC transporter substrate-binding protein, partial [Deltaproteobacteria bacterium]|nr:ABC transporter substrate-binding protein [Deltaproteobacteria bacterium]